MKRKDYEKPAMKVVKLQHQAQLLTGSNVDANGSFLLGNGWTDIGGDAEGVETLSTSKVTFKAGSTYSKYLYYGHLDATPLTMKALTAGTVQVSISEGLSSGMKYSVNGGTKTTITETTNIAVNKDDEVYFYGNGTATWRYGGFSANVRILGSGDGFKCKVYGNIMSLLDEKDFANKTSLSNTHIFNYLFDGNTALTTAPDLLAPALPILDALDCYASMFKGCTNLNYVKCLATSGSFKYASNWLSGVAATGTFYKAKGVSWNRDGSGIPTG